MSARKRILAKIRKAQGGARPSPAELEALESRPYRVHIVVVGSRQELQASAAV